MDSCPLSSRSAAEKSAAVRSSRTQRNRASHCGAVLQGCFLQPDTRGCGWNSLDLAPNSRCRFGEGKGSGEKRSWYRPLDTSKHAMGINLSRGERIQREGVAVGTQPKPGLHGSGKGMCRGEPRGEGRGASVVQPVADWFRTFADPWPQGTPSVAVARVVISAQRWNGRVAGVFSFRRVPQAAVDDAGRG